MKKLFLIFLLICSSAHAGITDLKLSTAQIFDVQWYISGGMLNTSGFNYIYSSINYDTQTTSAARWTAAQTADAGSNGRYIGFFHSTTHPGTYGMAVYNSDGSVYKLVNNTGSFRTLADGAIFYNGNGMWGTLITTKQGYTYGQSASFTITQEYPTNAQLEAYTPDSTTPLAAGEVATTSEPPPSYSAAITPEQQAKIDAARARQTYKNEVNIEQIGNYNNIEVMQSGFYHLVDISITGDSNNLDTGQYGIKNYAAILVQGSGNSVNNFQSNSAGLTPGHFSEMLISGNNNSIINSQTGDGEKINFISINGDSNMVRNYQSGAGSKYSDLKVTGSGHSIMLEQKDLGQHAARIEVINNGGASNINILQQGNTNQIYSIQQSCATAGGCSVTITQQ